MLTIKLRTLKFQSLMYAAAAECFSIRLRLRSALPCYARTDVKPAYAFGHGLTYTTFTYSELAIDANTKTVSFHVQNSGSNTGSEVAQLYIEFPAAAGEPPKQLKEFSKFTLAPGESTGVVFKLSDRSFSIWDVTQHAWALQAGDFGIMVGSSSDDIRLKGTLQISAI